MPTLRPAEDPPPSLIASAATVRNLPWHALVARRSLAVTAGFVIAFALVGTVYILLGLNRNFQGGSQASPALQSAVAIPTTPTEPVPSSSQTALADRIEPTNPLPNTQSVPQGDQIDTAGAGGGGVVTQRAVLFEEDCGAVRRDKPPKGRGVPTGPAASIGGEISRPRTRPTTSTSGASRSRSCAVRRTWARRCGASARARR